MMYFHNTLSGKRTEFKPIDPKNVRMYVCGPTVYDRIHIGNARPIIVYDVLFRLLKYKYPNVTYVRNITDIDDKIINKAKQSKIAINDLTAQTIDHFHNDAKSLGSLLPTHEPKATDFVNQMIEMITKLIEKGHAYVEQDHVLFDTTTAPKYGELSKRSIDDMIAGARVEVAPYKKNPSDFVLWKPSEKDQPGWDSPFINKQGRPGWHIECSAMAKHYLGETFDIHGGGIDLIFPHHENEMAQSNSIHGTDKMANYWIHNGFVNMNGKKMAKSDGEVIQANELIEKYGGEVVRLALLMTHYRSPIDLDESLFAQAKTTLNKFQQASSTAMSDEKFVDDEFIDILGNDLNTPGAIAHLHKLSSTATYGDKDAALALRSNAMILGLLQIHYDEWKQNNKVDREFIEEIIRKRNLARANKDFKLADKYRKELSQQGIRLEDAQGKTTWSTF